MAILTSLGGLQRVTLSRRVKEATHWVAAVGALPQGVRVKLGLVGGKHLPAGLHAVEASYVSGSVWTGLVILNLLDGLVGVDPASHIMWTRFRRCVGIWPIGWT